MVGRRHWPFARRCRSAAQPLPIENIQLRGDRFRGLHYREMTEEQRALLYNVVNSARAVTNTTGNGPFNTLLRTPQVGELSQQLGNAIRFSSGLSGRLREMATLMAGRAWTSSYEWYAHARYALDEGIDASVVDGDRGAPHAGLGRDAGRRCDGLARRRRDPVHAPRHGRHVPRSARRPRRAATLELGDDRGLLRVRLDAPERRSLPACRPMPRPRPRRRHMACGRCRPMRCTASRKVRSRRGRRFRTRTRSVRSRRSARASSATTSCLAQRAQKRAAPCSANGIAAPPITREPGALSPDAMTARRFATELLDTRFVSDATFAAALDTFGERGLVNLMVLMGHSNIRCAQQALAGAACVL